MNNGTKFKRLFGVPAHEIFSLPDKEFRVWYWEAGDNPCDYYEEMMLRVSESEDDEEEAHRKADQILCRLLIELGYDRLIDAWEEVRKWYS